MNEDILNQLDANIQGFLDIHLPLLAEDMPEIKDIPEDQFARIFQLGVVFGFQQAGVLAKEVSDENYKPE